MVRHASLFSQLVALFTVSVFMSWFTDIDPNATLKGSVPGINLWPCCFAN